MGDEEEKQQENEDDWDDVSFSYREAVCMVLMCAVYVGASCAASPCAVQASCGSCASGRGTRRGRGTPYPIIRRKMQC